MSANLLLLIAMQNLRDNMRVFDPVLDADTGRKMCARSSFGCVFPWFCNSIGHAKLEDGKRVGLSFLYEEEWDQPDKAPARPCVLCQIANVNYLASSKKSIATPTPNKKGGIR